MVKKPYSHLRAITRKIITPLHCLEGGVLVLVFMFVFVFLGLSLSQAQILIPDRVSSLSEKNIRVFLGDMQDISSGKMAGLPTEDLILFLNDHIAEHGRFESEIRYDIPGHDSQMVEAYLTKTEYIEGVANNQTTMRDYETSVDVVSMDILARGEQAMVKTIIRESGNLPIPQEEGEPIIVPVIGESQCEQKLQLTRSKMVQLIWAECQTVIALVDSSSGSSTSTSAGGAKKQRANNVDPADLESIYKPVTADKTHLIPHRASAPACTSVFGIPQAC